MNAFAKYFASIYMNLLVRDEEILKKKYNAVCNKFNNLFKKNLIVN